MQIIPVLDLKDGVVVHAKRGQRELYAPIHSPLCQSAELEQVIAAYLNLYPFTTYYIADLNAIAGHHEHQALINNLLTKFQHLTFWIDSGYQTAPSAYHQYLNYLPVLGSESYSNTNYSDLGSFQKSYILSLDFSDTHPLGAEQLFASASLWPKHIIIMTLNRVGDNQGPDFEKLRRFVQQYSGYQFIAAGGIRNLEDLWALKTIGISSALLASALHSGAINGNDLHHINTR
ncbi:MAG: HisA/HisF-related TIM barrel protein [Methylococcales bacterium]